MRLTSSVKELDAILQKLIKFEPGIIPGRKMRQKRWLVSMAMRITSCEVWARCNNGNNGSHYKNEKIKPFKSLSG